jgi:hypothetical protein
MRALPCATAVLLASFAPLACRTTGSSGADVKTSFAPTEPGSQSGTLTVSWPCAWRDAGEIGTGEDVEPGKRQDEYCEWDRHERDESQHLVCDFRTTWDTSRRFFMPMRAATHPWMHTAVNTREALERLFADCTSVPGARCGQAMAAGNAMAPRTGRNIACDPDRRSDPHICSKLQEYKFAKRRQLTLAAPENAAGVRAPAIQIAPDTELPRGCRYVLDPKTAEAMQLSPVDAGRLGVRERTYVRCEYGSQDSMDGDGAVYESCDDVAFDLHVGVSIEVTE